MSYHIRFFLWVLVGLFVLKPLMLGTSAQAQMTAAELREMMDSNKRQGQMTQDMMRAINGPTRDPNVGTFTDTERLNLLINAFGVKKNDGGVSRQKFMNDFQNQVDRKQQEKINAERNRREWIVNERARQKIESNKAVARENARRNARAQERRRIQQENERTRQANIRSAKAKIVARQAEKKRRADRYAAANRQRTQSQPRLSTTTTSAGYAGDGLTIDDIETLVVKEEPKKKQPKPTCACPVGTFEYYGLECRSAQTYKTVTLKMGGYSMHQNCGANYVDPHGEQSRPMYGN